jgi:hypothetical protein
MLYGFKTRPLGRKVQNTCCSGQYKAAAYNRCNAGNEILFKRIKSDTIKSVK